MAIIDSSFFWASFTALMVVHFVHYGKQSLNDATIYTTVFMASITAVVATLVFFSSGATWAVFAVEFGRAITWTVVNRIKIQERMKEAGKCQPTLNRMAEQ